MSNWAVIKDEKLFDGPFGWNPKILNNIFKNLGFNMSFPVVEPKEAILVDKTTRVVPMVTICPEITNLNVMNPIPVIEIFEDKIVYTYSVRDKTPDELNPPIPPPQPPSEEQLRQWGLENKYLEATKSLIELAGQTSTEEWTKLEDIDFETMAIAAITNNVGIATLLLSTLNYTFFQLKLLDVRWEDIQYHNFIRN